MEIIGAPINAEMIISAQLIREEDIKMTMETLDFGCDENEGLFQESEVDSLAELSTKELENKDVISESSTSSGESDLSDFQARPGKQPKYEHVPLDVKIKVANMQHQVSVALAYIINGFKHVGEGNTKRWDSI